MAVALLFGAPAAQAVGLIGDDTRLEAGWAANVLLDATIVLTPTGSASGIGEQLVLPVSGGDADFAFLEGNVQHVGSGFDLSLGGTTLSVQDLDIDLTNLLVTGTFDGTPGTEIFEVTVCPFAAVFDPCTERDGSIRIDGWGLRLTEGAALAIGEAFGIGAEDLDALSATHLLIADIDLRPVPEPGAALLLGGGLLGLSSRRWRHPR